MTRTALTLGVGLLALPVIVAVLVAGLLATILTGGPSGASATALTDIPEGYLLLYQQAATDCPGLDWALLAAIGKIESDHGRSTAPGVTHGENVAGAAGPMQFLQPTFAAVLAHHQLPAGGPSPPSRYDPHDAIHAAAAFLCDHHATTNPTAAVFAYNHADTYVTAVLTQAAAYRQTASLRTAWPPQRAEVPDPSGTGGYVTARTADLYRALAASGATREGATCWDPHLQNPDSDHPRGRACDLFFRPHDPTDVARGWNVARWLTAHQADYGLRYVIWQGQIWSTEHPMWTTYQSPIYGCPNPANLTGCHYNHLHFSAY
jgi:transglycosylase-like protein with SLT domain